MRMILQIIISNGILDLVTGILAKISLGTGIWAKFRLGTGIWYPPSRPSIQDYVHLDDQTQPTFGIVCVLWVNFILGLSFIFLCLKLIVIHYHTPKVL